MKERNPMSPPKFAVWLLKLFCRKDYLDEILGDLLEVFGWRVQHKGILKARIWFLLDVLSAVRFLKFGQLKYSSKISKIMWYSFIKNSLRNFRRHLSFTMLNVFGLAIGMMAALFILEYVSDELNYDQFGQSEDMYRVSQDFVRNEELLYKTAVTTGALTEAMLNELPQVEKAGRLLDYTRGWEGTQNIFTLPDDPSKTFAEPDAFFADPSIMDLFDLDLIVGVAKLHEPNTTVLSEEMANKYFGGAQKALGKLIQFQNVKNSPELIVTGVFKYPKFNLQVRPSALVSYASSGLVSFFNMWGINANLTYVKLKEGTDPDGFRADLAELLLKYNPLKTREDRMGMRTGNLYVHPVTSIHLNSTYQDEVGEIGDKSTVYVLIMIAVFIVIMAWINYINLTTANAINRSKEVGVRKVMGARKKELVFQFFTEAFLINLFAVFIAVALVVLGQGLFDQLVKKSLSLAGIDFVRFGISMVGIFVIGTFLSGLYPAVVLSSNQVLTALKGKSKGSNSGLGLRRGLIVFQLLFSSLLIMATLAIYTQLNFMNNTDLGLDMERVLVLEGPTIKGEQHEQKRELLNQRLEGLSNVSNVGISSNIPGKSILQSQSISRENSSESRQGKYELVAGSEYLNILDMRLIAGQKFDNESERKSTVEVLLNSTAVDQLGFSNPSDAVGESIYVWLSNGSQVRTIVGVVDDYHHESLNRTIDPMIFYPGDAWDKYYLLKLESGEAGNLFSEIEDVYAEVFPGNPANYYFLDQFFERQYQREEMNSKVFIGFVLIAIVVACLGLYGLSSFTALQRTKEIGIRKVLGAEVKNVFFILSKELMILAVIGFIIAIPIGYFLIGSWLESFAYRISFGPLLFIIPFVMVLVVTLLAISKQVIKAALMNPVKSLRYE